LTYTFSQCRSILLYMLDQVFNAIFPLSTQSNSRFFGHMKSWNVLNVFPHYIDSRRVNVFWSWKNSYSFLVHESFDQHSSFWVNVFVVVDYLLNASDNILITVCLF
jgi:hypothetical protein